MNSMLKKIKSGLMYLSAVVIAFVIVFFVNFANKYSLKPKNVYRVYLDGKVIGNVKSKDDFEDYINEEEKELKVKYNVDKVYIPSGVDIRPYTTYEKDVLTAKEVNNIITKEKPFTIKGYKITIKPNNEEDDKLQINVLNKKMFKNSVNSVLKAFLSTEQINNYKNDTQPEIKETGSLIEDIYIDQDIVIKEEFIPTDEEIFTDEKTLSKYLLFGEIKEDQYYTVKQGDTIESIAYDNKLATSEFLIVNPEFTSSTNLLTEGQQVKVGLINPILDVVVETHNVVDQESKYETISEDDSSLDAGTRQVIEHGQNGMDRLTTKIKTVNGETTNVVIVSSEVLSPSVPERVKVGTKQSGYTLPDGSVAPIIKGDWAWPTISQYFISSEFSYRWGKFHEALDIAGSGEGSPIYAAGDGTVVAAKVLSGSLGTYVIIEHANSLYTLYGHMSSLTVTEGQVVSKGQQIGTMGHTGFATGTHLHFGLYQNGWPYRGGTPLNPRILYN